MKRNAVLAVAAAWAVCLAGSATRGALFPKSYRIRLDRPIAVGTKYRLCVTSTRQITATETTEGKDPTRNSKVERELSGIVTVLAVNSQGLPTKVAWTLDKCIQTQDGKRTVLVPPGKTVIVESHQGGPKVTAKDPTETLSKDAMRAIAPDPHVAEGPPPDEIFGTPKPREIGDSWPVNARQEALQLKALGKHVSSRDITGRCTLVGLTKVHGVPSLDMKIEMTIRHFPLAGHSPPHVRISPCELKLTGRFTAPVSPSAPLVGHTEEEMTMTSDARGAVPNTNIEWNMKVKSVGHTTVELFPVPK